ncbi:hypothetical protein ACJRO7_014563 [Eucalyptus globulus]|uniref:Uncharacterized protein n=1 Tax=Eucalyptus globulus TaxID=34317 RepID=A0ABD3L6K6_EUCGL
MLFNCKLKSSSPRLLFRDAVAYHEAASSDRDSCSNGHKAAWSPYSYYALNFQGNWDRESNKETPARLLVSPGQLLPVKLPRES